MSTGTGKDTNVRESRKVLRRLARCQANQTPQSLQQPTRRPPIRTATESSKPPKTAGASEQLAQILSAQYLGPQQRTGDPVSQAALRLIRAAGALRPRDLTPADAIEADEAIRAEKLTPSTRWNYVKALRRILRWLADAHNAPRLDGLIHRAPEPRPRNVTITDDEREALLRASPPYLRLWLLLCSDLALRSETAAVMSPAHYNPNTGDLTFTTKYDEHLSLPATDELRALIAQCDLTDPRPFVRQLRLKTRKRGSAPWRTQKQATQLRREFQTLCTTLHITRRIRPHDLRRTTAVKVLQFTGDLRKVQALLGHHRLSSTFWYLDHNMTPVDRSTLETIKRPFIVPPKEKSA